MCLRVLRVFLEGQPIYSGTVGQSCMNRMASFQFYPFSPSEKKQSIVYWSTGYQWKIGRYKLINEVIVQSDERSFCPTQKGIAWHSAFLR